MNDRAKHLLRGRFWAETALASVTAVLLLLTLVTREWIELVLGVDPDGGDGTLEWTVVGILAIACAASVAAARAEWRRSPGRARSC